MADLLLVEDDLDLAKSLQQLLEVRGHHVQIASDGQDAILILQNKCPHLVISDIEMPFVDGPTLALLMHLTKQGLENIPIMLISGYPELSTFAQQIGTPYYLAKPFNIDAMLSMVEEAVASQVPPLRLNRA